MKPRNPYLPPRWVEDVDRVIRNVAEALLFLAGPVLFVFVAALVIATRGGR